jgi:ABC-type sugar transport system permease subunit
MQRSRVQTRITRPLGSNVPFPESGIRKDPSLGPLWNRPCNVDSNLFNTSPQATLQFVRTDARLVVSIARARNDLRNRSGAASLCPLAQRPRRRPQYSSADAVRWSEELYCGLYLARLALLLNEKFVGRNFLRALILIPWALPTIVNGALWMWIYQTGYGALNGLLLQLGLIDEPILWLGSSTLAMNMIIVADTWKVLPFYVILLLAGLQTIPAELYQAAAVDGANGWQRFRNVTLPSLRPVLLIILVLRTVDTFRVFDIIYQITQGGPGGGTTVVAYQAYQASFLQLQFGQGAAVAFVIAAAILIMAIGYLRLLSPEDAR